MPQPVSRNHREKYGTLCDFALVETSVASLGHQRPLTYEELRVFESPDQVCGLHPNFPPFISRVRRFLTCPGGGGGVGGGSPRAVW